MVNLGADLVTEYDRAVENMVSSTLKEKYPAYEYDNYAEWNAFLPHLLTISLLILNVIQLPWRRNL